MKTKILAFFVVLLGYILSACGTNVKIQTEHKITEKISETINQENEQEEESKINIQENDTYSIDHTGNESAEITKICEVTNIPTVFATISPTAILVPTPSSMDIPSMAPSVTPIPPQRKTRHLLENFKVLDQNDFPTGCESVSAVMVLNYLGFDITKRQFIDNYLDTISSIDEFYKDEANADKNAHDCFFVGNPRKESGTACNPPVIEKAVTRYFNDINETGYECNVYTGSSFEMLIEKLKEGNPVLLWVFVDLKIPSKTRKVGNFVEFTNRHTCVLMGVDEEQDIAYIADPISGKCLEWSLSRVKYNYEYRGYKAAIIEQSR